jgi:hypothetical protein
LLDRLNDLDVLRAEVGLGNNDAYVRERAFQRQKQMADLVRAIVADYQSRTLTEP